jgi:hypothetical protein
MIEIKFEDSADFYDGKLRPVEMPTYPPSDLIIPKSLDGCVLATANNVIGVQKVSVPTHSDIEVLLNMFEALEKRVEELEKKGDL